MKTFATREEAAIWLIQNPGREVRLDKLGKYFWRDGQTHYRSLSGYVNPSLMIIGTYTEVPLPEAEKTLEEKVNALYVEKFGYSPHDDKVLFHASLIRLAVEEAKKEVGK
jgi:hypothetical protein